MDHLPLVELVTRRLDTASDLGAHPCETVEAVRVDSGPRLEVPLGSRVTVDVAAGEGPPTVHVELLAGCVRFVDRSAAAPTAPTSPPAPDPDDAATTELAHLLAEWGARGVVLAVLEPLSPDSRLRLLDAVLADLSAGGRRPPPAPDAPG